jgi:hypothetical protein
MTLLNNIPHPSTLVYPQISKPIGLLTLLRYATRHEHSRQWVAAIHLIMRQKGWTHG